VNRPEAGHQPTNSHDRTSTLTWTSGLETEALANLAHELRTPIQVLVGYLDILRDEHLAAMEAEPREMIERINGNVYDLAQTIDNLMEFVLAEVNASPLIGEEISLDGLVAEISTPLEAANSRKRLEIKFDFDDAPPRIRAPRRTLRMIILNLALNAIKFTESGRVTIALRQLNGFDGTEAIEIEVSDTGPGMTPAMLDDAVKPFAQLSNSSARKFRGLGLGLPIVQRGAAQLGGILRMSVNPGGGSRFTVRFPADLRAGRTGDRARQKGMKFTPPPPKPNRPNSRIAAVNR
jgi:signal transduction histidine kinase